MVVKTEDGFILYNKQCQLRSNHHKKIFFFAKSPKKDNWEVTEKIPTGFEIIHSKFTNLPMLKRSI